MKLSLLFVSLCSLCASGCGIKLRPTPPPPQYHDIFVETKTEQTIVLPPQADTALITSIASRLKSLTLRHLAEKTPLRATDRCTPDGLRLSIDIAGLTFGQTKETTGSYIRPKATTTESAEVLYTQHVSVSRCSDNAVIHRADEEYDGKEVTRVLSSAAEDAADTALDAARKPR